MAKEYRVIWKREGLKTKRKRYANKPQAERFMVLMGPEPWLAQKSRWSRKGPDDLKCCSGHMCGCGGMTVREYEEDYRKDLPKLEWIRLEEREVGKWGEHCSTAALREGEGK